MCGPAGCCGTWRCRATTSRFGASPAAASPERPASTGPSPARPSTAAIRRRALSLTGFKCFIVCSVELSEERGIARGDFAVDPEARVGPAANPLAVVQVRAVGRSVAGVRPVVTAAGAERPRPARRAVDLAGDVVTLEKRRLRGAIDAADDVAEPVRFGTGEAMAERHVAG